MVDINYALKCLEERGVISSDRASELNNIISGLPDSNHDLLKIIAAEGAVPSLDYGTRLALGEIPGVFFRDKFGRNSDIDTGTTPEDVWEGGGNYTGHPQDFTPEQLEVVSSSADDAAGGTGATAVRLFGMTSPDSEDYIFEDVTLNGTTPVSTQREYWRMNRAIVLNAGSGGVNAGVITTRAQSDNAIIFSAVPVGFNQTQIAATTIPKNKTAVIKQIRCALSRANGSAGSATVSLRIREHGSGAYRAARVYEVTQGHTSFEDLIGGIRVNQLSDIKFTVDSVSDGNTIIETSIGFYMRNNL